MNEYEFPGWRAAPDQTATHWDTCSGKWYREASGHFCEAHPAHGGQWYRSSHRNSQLGASRFIRKQDQGQPEVWAEAPADATHYHANEKCFYQRGDGQWALAFKPTTWGGSGEWINSRRYTNHHLLTFTERPNTPTSNEVTFTMSEEQAKELALDARPMKVVTARFSREQSAKEYHYFAPADAKSGDYAIVYANDNIIREGGFPFSVVQIVSDEVVDTSRATKAILGTFNEDFAKHVQARVEHMARVKAKLQAKKKQFEEAAIFEMLATKDPEAAALLAELKTFNL